MTKRSKTTCVSGATRRAFLQTTAGGLTMALASGFAKSALAQGKPQLKTANPGVITMATTGDMPMVAVRNGELVGTDADLLKLIADRLGLGLKAEVMEWSACLAAVPAGRADWVGGNTSWTVPRSTAMMMTDDVYYTGSFALMKQDQPFAGSLTLADLSGHSVGTGSGFSTVPELRRVPGTSEVKLYDSIEAGIRDVVAGRLDFAFLDAPIVAYMISQNTQWGLKMAQMQPDPAFPALTGINEAVWGMNADNPDLYDAVNQGIKWLWKTKQIGPVLAKYGVISPDYLRPPAVSLRLGHDRDQANNQIGSFAHQPKDFSQYFGA